MFDSSLHQQSDINNALRRKRKSEVNHCEILRKHIRKMLKQRVFDFLRFSILILIFVLFSGSKLFDDDKCNSNAMY